MHANPKVSVIVPVYNVEKYLKECLDSLVNQTLKNIEIILVDDGSTDSSAEICEEYAKNDSRIKIIKQQNQKQGAARNRGLNEAKGEYVGFVDSDDWIDLDFYEKLYNSAVENNADIACANIYRVRKHIKKYRIHYKKVLTATNIQDKIKICADQKKFFFSIFNRIYKNEKIQEKNIRFVENKAFEDVEFSARALFYLDKLVTVPDTRYYYRLTPGSTINSEISERKAQERKDAFVALQKFAGENNIKLPEKALYHTTKVNKILGIPFIKTYTGEEYTKICLLSFIPFKFKNKK